MPPEIEVTPLMVEAAWAEVRRWWPRRVVQEIVGGQARLRILETAIKVDEPMPGFREALAAALKAGGYSVRLTSEPSSGGGA